MSIDYKETLIIKNGERIKEIERIVFNNNGIIDKFIYEIEVPKSEIKSDFTYDELIEDAQV